MRAIEALQLVAVTRHICKIVVLQLSLMRQLTRNGNVQSLTQFFRK